MIKRLIAVVALTTGLAACNESQFAGGGSTKHLAPIPPATMALMATKGVAKQDPILVRIYKKESELEVYKKTSNGRYAHLKTYPICRWSGQLGPKQREGDRQAPEGLYTVTPAQMNPNSSLYLSFNLGYPNAFDRAHGRTGAHLMVHGSCSSMGCFAMTDEAISEVYALAREAFAGGQRGFQVQSLPFRMTPENLAKHRADPNIAFWRNLKEGTDIFDVAKIEPSVTVAAGRYAFPVDDSSTAQLVAQKQANDEREVAALTAKGVPAVRVVYEDGGAHQTFREMMMAGRTSMGDVSRPESLSSGPREIAVTGSGSVSSPSTSAAAVGPRSRRVEANAE